MPAIYGAKKLYDTYKDSISFGIHLNLTEGTPVLKSQILLDNGIYLERNNGEIIFNKKNSSSNKFYNKEIRKAIFRELSAQIEIIKELDIQNSHIDGHHHIHTRPFMFEIIPSLQDKYKFTKIRRLRNCLPSITQRTIRNIWWYIIHAKNNELITTDYFADYTEFVNIHNKSFIKNDAIVELMVHPGGKKDNAETELLKNMNIKDLINYNQI